MQKYQGYIYCITNHVNSKIYIGQTRTSIEERYASHIRCSRSKDGDNILLYLAMRKYGVDNFSIDLVECIRADSPDDLRQQLNEREIFHIKEKCSFKPNGYNMTTGGDKPPESDRTVVVKLSENGDVLAEYESIAEASRQNNIAKNTIRHALSSESHYSGGYYWRTKDDSFNATVGDNVGRQSRTDITPVYCFGLDGALIKKYKSISDAKREVGVSQGKISEVCNGNRQSTGGYLWSYTSTPPVYNPRNHTCRCKSVLQMTLDGMPIRKYCSASEAARDLKLQSSLITACCTGRRKSTGGYRWTFSM